MNKEISIKWCVDDVLSVRRDLTEEQAYEVLKYTKDHHNAEVGINWIVLETNADNLFPKEDLEELSKILLELSNLETRLRTESKNVTNKDLSLALLYLHYADIIRTTIERLSK